ncbi:MAG: enolase C-terminal domain-like protein [Pseudomonadota bacterium]
MTSKASGPHRIMDIDLRDVVVSPQTTWRHVRLMTESGFVGLGEATLSDPGPGYGDRLHHHALRLIGADALENPLKGFQARRLDLANRTILSALDQAIMDIRAQISARPLCLELGGCLRDEALPLYANINRATRTRTPKAFARNAKAAAKEGFEAIKIAPFDGLGPDLCGQQEGRHLIDAGLARIRAAREASADCDLMVDCHWRFTTEAVTALLPALREIGVVWLECPLPETPNAIPELLKLRRLANRHGMRLCGLETAGGWRDVAPYVQRGTYDLVMPDVKHAGGLENIMEIARQAQAAGIGVSLHNPSGPVAHLVSVHVMAALGSEERMEIQWHESPLFYEVTDPPPVIEGGVCRPTSTSGLGTSLRGDDFRSGVS